MKVLIIAMAASMVSAPAMAQQHGHHHGGERQGHGMGMMAEHCKEMMGGLPPAMVLQHREQLGLTPDQVRRIEAIQARTGGGHMQAVMAAHREAAEILQADRPDFSAYEAKLREATGHMVQAHVEMARATVETRTILTAEQRARLERMDHRGMMGGMMGHGRHGEGHEGHGAMMGMMGCPMMHGMGAEHQDHGAHHNP
jgi:Spy/CpxP family protein refolding chaperone